MFRFLFLSLYLFFCPKIIGQSIKPTSLIQNSKQPFIDVPLFEKLTDGSRTSIPTEIEPLSILQINTDVRTKLLKSTDTHIKLSLPNDYGGEITLDLVEVSPLAPDFVVKSAPSMEIINVSTGRHFRGVIKGVDKSIAAISIFDNEVMGLISHPRATGNMVLGRIENSEQYILYQDDQLPQTLTECATKDTPGIYTHEQLSGTTGERALTDCVRLFIEVDYDIYISKGSSNTTVTSFVTGIFNQVSTLYANEQINSVISELVIWSAPSPYNATSATGMLNAFTSYRQGFNGNLAQLLSYKVMGGVAYLNGLCGSNPDFSMSYAGINSSYQNVPAYSWTVEVCAHEFGHLFGSKHTHACVWNGNNTAIDGCYVPEGGCANPGLPNGAGTIMSYCHLTNNGINFANGFGTQPGNVMRAQVINAPCLQSCDVDGGGPACSQNQLLLTIRTDNYPNETSWSIKNSGGTTLYSGSGYAAANTEHTINLCLPGECFMFTINDTYGDGFCCNFGQGFYNIKQGNTILISGGTFGSSEVKNFCAGGTPPSPSCTDGIKNGTETGVDCGGNCPACPTCTDGIKNGSETGVDCGGNCPACPTCTDGIKNGSETGVDCGGSCPPCSTGSGQVQMTTIAGHYFETSWDGWLDGGVDAFRYLGTLSPEGSYSIRLRDNEGSFSSMTSPTYNLTTYDSVTVQFKARASSIETGKDFWLMYFNGNTWNTIKAYVSGTDFTNDNVFIRKLKISGPLSSVSAFKIQADAEDNSDLIYIDAIEIKAYKTTITEHQATCFDGIRNGLETGVDCGGGICSPCNTGNGSGTLISGYYFENGWDGWLDGGVDAYRYMGNMSPEGSYSIRLRDNSQLESAMTSPAINLSAYTSVNLQFKFFADGMEAGEDFIVQYFDGISWSTIATLVSGTNFDNLALITMELTLTNNLVSNAKFRFMCDGTENDDIVYIDAVVLTGYNGQMIIDSIGQSIKQDQSKILSMHESRLEQFEVYPNPTTDIINTVSSNIIERLKVISATGQEMINFEPKDYKAQIDLTSFISGMYLIVIQDENGISSKRIIKN